MPLCSACGEGSPAGFRFCGACGAALDPLAASLAEERKTITVLFADLVGFTSRADRLDPEDVRRMLDPYHACLRREVERHGGAVEKFIGDEVMAVFGAPIAHEDDPERAVRAALSIREAVAELGDDQDESDLGVRVGVNTGEALVKPGLLPGEGERIVADFVNVAARLVSAAPVGGILVGEATYLPTARAIDYRAFDPVRAKGKAEPVLAWEAVAPRARIGAAPRGRGRAPLFGRADEVQILCDAFARARRERSAQLVTLVGPPGIGKSRLVLELSSVAEDDPELVSWRRGACLPYGEGVSFWPFAEMVKAQSGILESDSAEEAGDKLRREVADAVQGEEDARWVEQRLRPLLGLAGPDEAHGERREHFAAWRRFVESLADQSPFVLVFEDLHWADEGLLEFVDYLVDWVTGVPLLVVCTARPELLVRRADWGGGKPNATTISLSPLSDDETEALLADLLEQAQLPIELTSTLLARAGGNALYAEEFVRMAAERSVSSDEELPVPGSVQGIVAARLDTLPPEEKAALQDAAVIGRVFWLGAVAHLSGIPKRSVEDLLRSLERKQFVVRDRRSSVERETEYAFPHLLVRDVAYGQIPRARRADRHRLAAEWIESLGRPEDHAETFAHHYVQALELTGKAGRGTAAIAERARVALAEAGDRALALKSFSAAARFYKEALALWPRDDERWALLRFRQGKALFWAEEAGADALAEASEALLSAGDPETAAEAEVLLGRLAFRQGHGDAMVERYQRALALLRDAEASASKAYVLSALSRSLNLAAESEAAIAVGRETLAMAEELGLDEVRAIARMTIGDARVETGDLQGLVDFERGIALALELNSPESISGYINLADVVTDLGNLAGAIELREHAQLAAERFGDAQNIRWLRAERAGEAYSQGRWDESLALADAFIAECEAGDRHYQEGYARVTRGRIRLARGDSAGAIADARRALEIAREAKDPQSLCPALCFGARAFAGAGRLEDATASVDEVLTLLRQTEKTPVAYLWLHDLAVALVDLGKGAELRPATAAVRKRTPWLEAALALADGDPAQAAELYGEIGARPDQALAQVRAAAWLRKVGRSSDADEVLEQALDFYRSVGADLRALGPEPALAVSEIPTD